MDSRHSIRQVQGFTGHGLGLGHNAMPDIKVILLPLNIPNSCLHSFGHIIVGGIKSVLP
jgi:hypothetical protein